MSFSRIISLSERLRNYRSFSVPSSSGGGYKPTEPHIKLLNIIKSTSPLSINRISLMDLNEQVFGSKITDSIAGVILSDSKINNDALFKKLYFDVFRFMAISGNKREGNAHLLLSYLQKDGKKAEQLKINEEIRKEFIVNLFRNFPPTGQSVSSILDEINKDAVEADKVPFGKNNYLSSVFWTEGDGKSLIDKLSPTIIMNQITPLIYKFNAGDHLKAASIYLGRAYNESERIIIGIAMRIVFDFEITDQKEDVTKNDSETQIMKKNELIRIITRAHLINKIKKNKISEISKDYDR